MLEVVRPRELLSEVTQYLKLINQDCNRVELVVLIRSGIHDCEVPYFLGWLVKS